MLCRASNYAAQGQHSASNYAAQMAAQGQHRPVQGQQLCCTGPAIMRQRGIAQGHVPAQSFYAAGTLLHRPAIMLHRACNYAAQGLQLYRAWSALLTYGSPGQAKHRYTRGFEHLILQCHFFAQVPFSSTW